MFEWICVGIKNRCDVCMRCIDCSAKGLVVSIDKSINFGLRELTFVILD
jgi:hypothetical protein